MTSPETTVEAMTLRKRLTLQVVLAALLLCAPAWAFGQSAEATSADEDDGLSLFDDADAPITRSTVQELMSHAVIGVASVAFERENADAPRLVTGFVISQDGYIVSAAVDGATKASAHFADGSEQPVTIVGVDRRLGITLLKIDSETPLSTVPMGSAFNVDSRQITLIPKLAGGPGATIGSISGLVAPSPGTVRLVTSAAVTDVSVGAPLLDLNGHAIGVVVAGGTSGEARALPIDLLHPILEQLKAGKPAMHSYLGVTFQKLDEQLARAYGVSTDFGVAVGEISDDSPAADVLQVGDLVMHVAGAHVDDPADVAMLVGAHSPGTTVEIIFERNGEERVANVELTPKAGSSAATPTVEKSPAPPPGTAIEALGIRVEPLTEEAARAAKLRTPRGVLVAERLADSGDALKTGDIIVSAAGTSIASPDTLLSAVESQPPGTPIRLVVVRDQRQMLLAVPLHAPAE